MSRTHRPSLSLPGSAASVQQQQQQQESEATPLHVYDLPQLYQKPSAVTLLRTLDLLSWEPPTFSATGNDVQHHNRVAEEGVPRYLTSIIASSLSWIVDEDARGAVWDAASARLSERAGRSAMPAMTRCFAVNEALSVRLHEPSLTEDNLGLKTWSSSLLLSRRLEQCRHHIPSKCPRVLELGAGTGLVGISAACTWNTHAVLTDLPEIVPNLQRNLDLNAALIEEHGGSVTARALDWADESNCPQAEEEKFMVILAADPIYSSEHPKLLVNAVRRWIRPVHQARFIVELPLRDSYDEERKDLRKTLRDQAFELLAEGTDTGYDDWQGRDGNPMEVQYWWSIWKPAVMT